MKFLFILYQPQSKKPRFAKPHPRPRQRRHTIFLSFQKHHFAMSRIFTNFIHRNTTMPTRPTRPTLGN